MLELKVLIAEDVHMVRGALAALLTLEPDISVVAEVECGDMVVPTALKTKPDVAVIDIDMPRMDGLTAAQILHEKLPSCRTLILTGMGRPGTLRRALAVSVSGFLLKDAPADQLAAAVRGVAAGRRIVDPPARPVRLGHRREPAVRARDRGPAPGVQGGGGGGDRGHAAPVGGHGAQPPDQDRHQTQRPQPRGRHPHRHRGRLGPLSVATLRSTEYCRPMPRGTSEVSEPMYFVLTALRAGPLHGHAISKSIKELSAGRVQPSVGTLYGILERLNERGVITVDREETVNGRNRRYFRITDEGQALVEAEARRMHEAAALVLRPSSS
ncbi:hypothetical protein GCM10020001_043660 [Nonomuraea salmonea]